MREEILRYPQSSETSKRPLTYWRNKTYKRETRIKRKLPYGIEICHTEILIQLNKALHENAETRDEKVKQGRTGDA